MKRYAVLTGDIVGYSTSAESRKITTQRLNETLKLLTKRYGNNELPAHSLFRGDSFQWVTDQISRSLRAALIIRTGLNALTPSTASKVYDARIAIGIGVVEEWAETLASSDGEAFRNSGPFLDEMEFDDRIRIRQENAEIQGLLTISASMGDVLSSRWSPLQAEALFRRLQDKSQKEIATELSVSGAAISQRLNAMHWPVIANWLAWYEEYFQ